MISIPIHTPVITDRLIYVLDWLFKEQLDISYTLSANADQIKNQPLFISYGSSLSGAISIPADGLLFETGVVNREIKTGKWKDLPTLFDIEGHSIPFDILSAVFYLLSRYEEYYSFTADKHGRYPATDSVLYKNNCLRRPIVDEWVYAFKILIEKTFQIILPGRAFSFLPTYDIDIAWSYKNKGFVRTLGAGVKDILRGNFKDRFSVLSGAKDPYDSFDWLKEIHNKHHLNPIFFILASLRTTTYDKNIAPQHPAMQSLIKALSGQGDIGMHPSYYSTDKKNFSAEKEVLSNITGKEIKISRQHYIKLKIPDTYRLLMAEGITDDYSMGYGSHLGFRAGTGQSFYWYDIQNEKVTSLRVHPFCFMDTTALYEERLNAAEAFNVLREMKMALKDANSILITVFHNFSLGTAPEWKGWKDAYKDFINSI